VTDQADRDYKKERNCLTNTKVEWFYVWWSWRDIFGF